MENGALRGIFGTKKEARRRGRENCIMKSSIACTHYQILLRLLNQEG
jgi:hypothetical protein